jgi:hypothetical protein
MFPVNTIIYYLVAISTLLLKSQSLEFTPTTDVILISGSTPLTGAVPRWGLTGSQTHISNLPGLAGNLIGRLEGQGFMCWSVLMRIDLFSFLGSWRFQETFNGLSMTIFKDFKLNKVSK